MWSVPENVLKTILTTYMYQEMYSKRLPENVLKTILTVPENVLKTTTSTRKCTVLKMTTRKCTHIDCTRKCTQNLCTRKFV